MARILLMSLLVGTPTATPAQQTSAVDFRNDGLRMDGRVLLRGVPGDTLAKPRWWRDASLPLDALLSDSAKAYGARFNRDGRRAQAFAAAGRVLVVGGIAVAWGHDSDLGDLALVNGGDAAGRWGTRAAVGGGVLALLGSALWARAVRWRDRALWAHNLAVATQP